jgi:hypothetical protein
MEVGKWTIVLPSPFVGQTNIASRNTVSFPQVNHSNPFYVHAHFLSSAFTRKAAVSIAIACVLVENKEPFYMNQVPTVTQERAQPRNLAANSKF